MNTELKQLAEKIVGQEIASDNRQAFEAYSQYKKTISIMDRVNVALGRKPKSVVHSSSSLEVKISSHAHKSAS